MLRLHQTASQLKLYNFYGQLNFCYKEVIITDDVLNEIIHFNGLYFRICGNSPYCSIYVTTHYSIRHDWEPDFLIGTN